MKLQATWAAAATGLLLAAGTVSAETLTFEDLAAGTVLSNQYAAQGVVFSANAFSGAGSSSSAQDWATNTDMTVVSSTGTDVGGLGTPSLVSGNILRSFSGWLGEDGDPSFTISFATPITAISVDFAGVSTGADVRLFAFNGTTALGSAVGSSTGQFTLSLGGGALMTHVVVTPGSFNDWVGVDNISFTAAVPEASTYAMMGLGLALLAFKRRKQQA